MVTMRASPEALLFLLAMSTTRAKTSTKEKLIAVWPGDAPAAKGMSEMTSAKHQASSPFCEPVNM
jgi:hypothetical protein